MHGENLHWGSLGSIKNNSSVLNLYWKASENRVQTVQVQTVSFPARSAGAEMKSLQPLKAYSMKRPHEEANAGPLQPVRRVRRKTPGAEVQPGFGAKECSLQKPCLQQRFSCRKFAVSRTVAEQCKVVLQQQAMQVEAPDGVPDAEAAEVPGCRVRLCSGVFLCSLGK